jgi:hypothetical protein
LALKNRVIKIILTVYFGLFILLLVVFGYHWTFYEEAPDQPIAFSHKKHVGELELECLTCHTYVEVSIHANVPAVSICMSCHENVATDKPEIQKLTAFWQEKKPIPWAQVYQVKDHVYFSHKRHIIAGLDCSNCHGEVEVMDKIRRVRSLKMGWCVDCHRSKEAPLDCYTCHK